jgi:hypothetical protein
MGPVEPLFWKAKNANSKFKKNLQKSFAVNRTPLCGMTFVPDDQKSQIQTAYLK